jgi:hypothetical protein
MKGLMESMKKSRMLVEAATYVFVERLDNIYEVYKSRDDKLSRGKFVSTNELVNYLNSEDKVIVLDKSGMKHLLANFSL